jgi:hypothetical protein
MGETSAVLINRPGCAKPAQTLGFSGELLVTTIADKGAQLDRRLLAGMVQVRDAIIEVSHD